MADLITGMFRDRDSAERAVADLQQLGYAQSDISVMMNDQTRAREFAADTGTKAAEGAGVGAGIGGTLGAIIAAVTATGSVAAVAATGGLAAPLVAGPLAAALAGAGVGGLGGGLIGGLIGAGIPQNRAAQYDADLNADGILVGVHASGVNAARVQRVLMPEGAVVGAFAGAGAVAEGRVESADAGFGQSAWSIGAGKSWGDPVATRPPGDPGEDAPPPGKKAEQEAPAGQNEEAEQEARTQQMF